MTTTVADHRGLGAGTTYLKSSIADRLDSFGYATALSGDTAVVAANWEASKSAGIVGAVYVFK